MLNYKTSLKNNSCQVPKPKLYFCFGTPSPELVNDLSLHMLLLENSSPLLNVIGLQPCWSWLDRLAADYMKGTKAISALHPHTPTLTPHSVLGWRQGGRDSGTVGQTEEREGGFLGAQSQTL